MNEQRLYSHTDSMALSASAGSGKTYALTTRLLMMLFAGLAPSEIIAITFTRLASNEIRVKLFSRLSKIEGGDPEEVGLFSRVLHKKGGDVIEAARLLKRELVRQFSLLQISTIHRFLTRIVRRFPGETGLVDFTVIEDEEKNSLIDDAIERFYRTLENNGPLLDRVYGYFLSLGARRVATAQTIRKVYDEAGGERLVMKEIRDTTDRAEELFHEKRGYLLSTHFEKKILELIAHIQRMLDIGYVKNLKKFQQDLHSYLVQKNIRKLLVLTPFSNYAEKGLLNYIKNGMRRIPDPDANAFLELFHEIRDTLCDYVACEMDYFVRIRFDIYGMIDGFYRESKRLMQCIDFADMERFAEHILEGLGSIDDLAYSLDSGMRYILIDEFQDTSVTQWRLLRRIVDGALKRGGTLFYVGDIKQSIYRWRGGEPGLFRRVQRELGIPGENLPYTYRQNRVLLDFVNKVFSAINDTICTDYEYETQLYPPHRCEAERGFVRVEPCEDREEVLQRIIDQIADLQKNGVSADDIAVLCRTNKEIEELEMVLKGNGIVFSSAGKTRIMDDYCGLDLLEILRFVVNSEDELRLAGVLRTPLFRKEYSELAGYRDESGRLTAAMVKRDPDTYGLLMDILSASRYSTPSGFLLKLYGLCNIYSAYPGKMDVINDFYECACRFEEISERACIADFVSYLEKNSESLTVRVGETHGVTVQTVHGSKGLEYQTVILPFLAKSYNPRFDKSILYMRDEEKNVARYVIGNKVYMDYFDDRDALREMKARAVRDYRIDELNILYVAMTRARENLILFPLESTKGTSVGDIVRKAIIHGYSIDGFPLVMGEVVPSVEMTQRKKQFYALQKPIRARFSRPRTGGDTGTGEYAVSEVSVGTDRSGGRVGRLRGLVFHHIMESVREIPVGESSIEQWIRRGLSLYGRGFTSEIKAAAVLGIKERALEVLADDRLSEYFSSYGHAEVTVFSRIYRNLLARIDRIVIGDVIRIIDFKTNTIESDDDLKQLTGYYREQVISYCRALSYVYPEKPLKGALYFTEAPFEKRLIEVFST